MTVGRASIRSKLLRSHGVLAAVAVLAMVTAVVLALGLTMRLHRLSEVRAPTALASLDVLAGVERSQAAVRGIIVLGDDQLTTAWSAAWDEQIGPTMIKLAKLAELEDQAALQAALDDVERVLSDLRASQWWIVDVSSAVGNEPARAMYELQCQPHADRILGGFTTMLERAQEGDATPARVELLAALADARFAFAGSQAALLGYLAGGRAEQRSLESRELVTVAEKLQRVAAASAEFDDVQTQVMAWLPAHLATYRQLSAEAVALRGGPGWNLARQWLAEDAVPLAVRATELLRTLSEKELTSMHRTGASVTSSADRMIVALVCMTLLLAIGAFVLGRRASTRLAEPLITLSAATRELASGAVIDDLPERGDAEIVDLTRSFNRMRRSLQESADALMDSEARTRAILDTAVDAIVTIGGGGVIQAVNPAMTVLFGYEADELVGANISMLMPSPDREQHDGYLDRYRRTGERRIIGFGRELVGQRKDGSLVPLHLSVGEMELGGRRVYTGILRDITAQREASTALERARDDAEEANRAKSRFLANMSHELRTPLNAIIGYSELLSEDAEEEGREDSVQDLGRIHRSGKHLLGLINDVLDLSKVEAGQMELHIEDADIRVLITETAGTVRPLIDQNDNELVMALGGDVGQFQTDVTRIRQILLNLLSNAAKFTKSGVITLSADITSSDDQRWLEISVRDSGIGMTAEQTARIFDAFAQADSSTTRTYGGTGLGLAIVKRFCTLMGGDITVTSALGEGTTFNVRLPEDTATAVDVSFAESLSTAQAIPADDGVRVLVIDDDPAARNLLTRMLGRAGYSVSAASNGADGLAMALETRPDLITLDVMMPSMDGWSVLTALKRDRRLAGIPVVMVTMAPNDELGHALGAADFLTKPVAAEQLLETVRLHTQDAGEWVLVVEDEADTRELLRRMLTGAGIEAEVAVDGQDALKVLADRGAPAAILLDLQMPRMDGFEFLETIRADPAQIDIPVIVVTASELSGQEIEVLRQSTQRVMKKHGAFRQELLDEIQRVLPAPH